MTMRNDTSTVRGARHTLRDESGAISMMAAALAFAMLLAGSLAVDVGRVAYVSRDQQGATNAAALDGARALRNGWTPARSLPEMYNVALDAAQASLGQNVGSSRDGGTSRDRDITRLAIGYVDDTGNVVLQYASDGSTSPGADLSRRPTTVVVDTDSFVDFVLGIGDELGGRDVLKSAVASGDGPLNGCPLGQPNCTPTNPPPPPGCTPPDPACTPAVVNGAVATIGVSTRLVELDANQSVVAGTMIDALLDPDGTNGLPTLTAVGWDGLSAATLSIADLVSAGLVAGTTEQVLDSTINVADLLDAAIAGLSTGDPALTAEAQAALVDMRNRVDPTLSFTFGELFGASTADPDAFLDATVDVADLVVGALQAANRDNLVTLDLAGATSPLPGLADYTLQLDVVEPPQFATGPAEQDESGAWVTRATTSQVSLSGDLVLVPDLLSETLGAAVGPVVEGLVGTAGEVLDPIVDPLCVPTPLLPCPEVPAPPPTPSVDLLTVGLDLSAADGYADLTDLQCATSLGDLTDLALGSSTIQAALTVNGETVPVLPVTVPGLPQPAGTSVQGEVELAAAGAEASVGYDDGLVTVTPFVDELLQPVLEALGISLGTVEGTTHDIQCTEVVVLPPDTPIVGG